MQQDLAQMRKDLDGLNLAAHWEPRRAETVLSQLERRTREQSRESARSALGDERPDRRPHGAR